MALLAQGPGGCHFTLFAAHNQRAVVSTASNPTTSFLLKARYGGQSVLAHDSDLRRYVLAHPPAEIWFFQDLMASRLSSSPQHSGSAPPSRQSESE